VIESRRVRALSGVALALGLVSGCDGSGAVTTLTSSELGSLSTTSAPESSSTVVSGLRSEFLALVVPLDGEEAKLGWEAYEMPAQRSFWSAQADCWDDNGFGELAEALRTVEPEFRSTSGRLFPDMAAYRATGFWRESEWTLGPEDVAYASSDESWLRDVLGLLPEGASYGVREVDVPGAHAVAAKCEHVGQQYWDAVTDLIINEDWWFTLSKVDAEPELAELIDDEVLPCLRDIDPEFSEVDSIDRWLATQFGTQADLDTNPDTPRDVFEEKMIYWGQRFAECMESLVEARREPRLEAREAFVDEHFTELLQRQSDIDEFLAGN
jgi:hypothetical protein